MTLPWLGPGPCSELGHKPTQKDRGCDSAPRPRSQVQRQRSRWCRAGEADECDEDRDPIWEGGKFLTLGLRPQCSGHTPGISGSSQVTPTLPTINPELRVRVAPSPSGQSPTSMTAFK